MSDTFLASVNCRTCFTRCEHAAQFDFVQQRQLQWHRSHCRSLFGRLFVQATSQCRMWLFSSFSNQLGPHRQAGTTSWTVGARLLGWLNCLSSNWWLVVSGFSCVCRLLCSSAVAATASATLPAAEQGCYTVGCGLGPQTFSHEPVWC